MVPRDSWQMGREGDEAKRRVLTGGGGCVVDEPYPPAYIAAMSYVLGVQRTLLKKHGPVSSRIHGLQEGTGIIGWMAIDYCVEQG